MVEVNPAALWEGFLRFYQTALENWKEWVPLAAGLLLYLLFVFKGVKLLLLLLRRLTGRNRFEWDDRLISAVENPLRFLFLLIGIAFAVKYLAFDSPAVFKLLQLGFLISIFWFLHNLADLLRSPLENFAKKAGRHNAEHIAEFVVKVVRFAIFIFAVLVVLQELGINVSALLASLGLGGLAVALAAKDTLSNVFGGITIIADNPFAKGDWVLINGKYEGVVESIGLRTTKLRTFEKSVLTLPNSLVANGAIENFSRRDVRRVKMYLGFDMNAPLEKVLKTIEEIREYLKNHPRVAKKEALLVYLDRIGDYSYDALVYAFTDTANWEEWLRIKQEWIENFMKIAEKNGTKLAYPTYEVLLRHEGQTP